MIYYIIILYFRGGKKNMEKLVNRKNVLKEAGVLLVAAILVLTSLVIVPMTVAQKQGHDVGVTAIVSPTTGPLQSYPVEVTIKNFGTYAETTDVTVIIKKGGLNEYADLVEDIEINPGESMNVALAAWYPSDIGEYQITACTQLPGDENPDNDCLTKTVHITIDFMGLGVAPLGLAELAIIDGILNVYNCNSSQPETDGVWINLEDSYNHWDMVMENPFFNLSRMYRSFQITTFVEPIEIFAAGEPVPGAEIFVEQADPPMCDEPIINVVWPQESASLKVAVRAFVDQNPVFYKENIPTEDGGLNIGHVNAGGQCDYLGFHVDNQLSVGCTYSSPVLWTWTEQDVINLSIDRIEVIPENLNQTFTEYYSFNTMYVENIPAFNVNEVYASFNNPPNTPTITGQTNGKIKVEYTYTSSTTDPQEDQVFYLFDWGDDTNSGWLGPYASGATANAIHKWTVKGTYQIKVKAKDIKGDESDWATLKVSMPRTYMYNPLILRLLERFPNAFPILRHLMGL
jgi:hypothetical protein